MIPKHVAIIPDGNRRWARQKGLKATFGHERSAQYSNAEAIFIEAKKIGIKYLSIWGFSTENWKRSKSEKQFLFNLFLKIIDKFKEQAHKNKISFRHIGRKDRLPKKLIKALHQLELETRTYKDFSVQLCLDYGGRDELLRAIAKAISSNKKEINEQNFSEFLDTSGIPDPDLIIRTSGEKRLSGLMPWQATYSELYFTKVHFPDFTPSELRRAVKDFENRHRRFGGN